MEFQSLFYWMLLSNCLLPQCYIIHSLLFQSLFYWMLLSNLQVYPSEGMRITVFQSLFYWMLLSNLLVWAIFGGRWWGCFNPCFIGCYSLTRVLGCISGGNWKFQSLFYWMLLSNWMCTCFLRLWLVCFNPCFIGCYSLTKLDTIGFGNLRNHVSILVLLDVTL